MSRLAGPKLAKLRGIYSDGCTQMRAGRHEDAAASFTAALALAPDFDDAAQNLGCCLAALGRMEEAARRYADVARMRPGDAASLFNLGIVLLAVGKPGQAVQPLSDAVRFRPDIAKHHQALGQAYIAVGRKAEALSATLASVRLDGDNPVALANLAGLLIDEERLQEAAGAALVAVQLAPENAYAQANLARALHGVGQAADALAPACAAVRLQPDDAGAAATLGAIQYTLGLYAEAQVQSRRAVQLDPALYQARANEAVALEALGHLDEAEHTAREAIALAPADHASARYNLACMLLRSGRLGTESWGLHEARLQLDPGGRRIAAIPRWAGEPVAGRTVLLHCEQGFGDTIQFARYVPVIRAMGARVVLVVQPALHRLLHDLPGADSVVTDTGPLPPHDVFCPLLSVPGVLGTTLADIPPPSPLVADPVLAAQWCLPPADVLQVGVVWAGNPSFVHDRARSVGLDAIGPLARIPGVVLHSLQLPAGRCAALPIVDRMRGVADFADTAAIVAGLSLVITVDSGVAHLAASMGKDVWLLSRFVGCWRWLRDRHDSPWYPTMRIYRQPRPGDWASVIERVYTDLSVRASR